MIEGLLGDGNQFGIKLSYAIQDEPKGIAQAFHIGEDFINGEPCALILGDNIFYGNQLPDLLSRARSHKKGASIFAYHVTNPQAFGVIDFDKNFKGKTIEEKPQKPKSNWAVTGLYFYDETVTEKARSLKPSARGELEITDLNRMYLDEDSLQVICMGRGMAWLDSGTHDSLIESSQFVRTIEKRQGLKIACLEEIAYTKGFISRQQLEKLCEEMPNSSYTEYVRSLLSDDRFSGE